MWVRCRDPELRICRMHFSIEFSFVKKENKQACLKKFNKSLYATNLNC